MGEQSTLKHRLSSTVDEALQIVDRILVNQRNEEQPKFLKRKEEQLKFFRAFDPTVEHAYSIPELGKRMGVTEEDADRIYRAFGRIIQDELEESFDFDYMYQRGRTSWPNLLLDAVKSDCWYFDLSPEEQATTAKRDRWYFTLGPELHAALVEKEILELNPSRPIRSHRTR